MADLVRYQLDDETAVYFEAANSDLVTLRGGEPEVHEGGRLGDRLTGVARAAEEVAGGLRSRLQPDAIDVEFAVKIASEINFWFFSKNQGEGSIKVKLTWSKS